MTLMVSNRRTILTPAWNKNELWRRARAVPSLDLRFAENRSLVDATTGANLVTFTRAGSGTFVDSQGTIQRAVTNLMLQSEDFSTTWAVARASISTNTITAPNGTVTSDKLVEDNSLGSHLVQQAPITFVLGTTYAYSVYAKAAERTQVRIQGANQTTFPADVRFDLSNGTIASVVSGTASIQAVGDGWYRCSVTATAGQNIGTNLVHYLVSGTSISYTGDGTSGLFLWGAQLEQSSTVGEYVPTTTVINSAPRFDHSPVTGESLGLLVEEQRTNLLLNSATLSTQSVTVTAVAHTLSFYGTGTITLSGASTAGPVTGTGVFPARTTLTFTPTAGSLTLTVTGSVVNAQLEAGAFATSYIPTTTSAATRSADVVSITGTAFSSWYRQDEGTIFARCSGGSLSNNGVSFDANDGTTSNRHVCNWSTSRVTTSVSNVIQSDLNLTDPSAANEVTQIAFAFKANDFGASFKGEAAVVDTSGTVPTVDRLTIGDDANGGNILNGHIRRLTYWPQRLPNNSLVGITR